MILFKLKTRKKYSEEVFAGFFIDQRTSLLLTLASLSGGISKSELIRKVLNEWMQKNAPTELTLVKGVAKRALDIFKYRNDYDTLISKEDFRRHLQLDLEKKKIPKHVIDAILNKFDGTQNE